MTAYEWRRYPGDASLADAFTVRRAVFIEEQGVDEAEEMDGRDETAVHYVVYDGVGQPVGTARLRPPEGDVAKPERVAVRRASRSQGLGHGLMDRIEAEARDQDCTLSRLHAQTSVVPFYEKRGYEVTSEEFVEADIPHVEMEKEL
ncbi:MAG: GNAT family N-acetyltransferase [Halovenus sp.]